MSEENNENLEGAENLSLDTSIVYD